VRRGRNREEWRDDPLLPALMGVLSVYQGLVRRTILKNIALMTRALLTLFSGARSGNGMLSKAALARCLPLESRAKARQTRLARFLANPHFTPEAMVPLLVALAVGTTFKERLPMIMDQTTLHGLPTLLVGLVFEGRVLPVAFTCFSYEAIEKSQNAIEHALMLTVAACFPPQYRPVLVMDRGYARAQLLPRLTSAGIPFLIRAPRNVCVFVGKERKSLGRFPAPRGSLARYEILYHGTVRYPVDLIIYHGERHEEPWYLIVPRAFALSAREIVDLYARRMCIEQGFRDWKTHLGLKGLKFMNPEPAPRLTRLLLSLALGYLILLSLGASPHAQELRTFLEVPRRKKRHGTTRTLSSLSIGLLRLSLEDLRVSAREEIIHTLAPLRTGIGAVFLFSHGPP
jgi:hypothetical protein